MVVKLRIFKREDGALDIIVDRTRWWEKPTRSAYGVSQKDAEQTIARLVSEMGEKAPRLL